MTVDERKEALRNKYGSSRHNQTHRRGVEPELKRRPVSETPPPRRDYYDESEDDEFDEDDYNNYRSPRSQMDSKQKKMLAGGIILAILLVVGSFFGFRFYKVYSDEKRASQALELGEFDEAENLYSDLYKRTGDQKYKKLRESVLVSKENDSVIDSAKNSADAGDYVEAVRLYASVSSEDVKNYEKAQAAAKIAQSKAIDKINNYVRDEDFTTARSNLDSLKSSMPDDSRYAGLETKISEGEKKKKVAENKPNETTIVYKTQGIERIADTSRRRAVEEYSQSIIGTSQSITSGAANVRNGPSKSSAIITSIDRGSTVYVEDTYVESADRIWCKVSFGGTVGWISYNTMNYSIR